MKITEPAIVVEASFKISKKELWDIITGIDHMHKWFFDSIPSFEPVEGFETSFSLSSGDREFDHRWKIIEVDPGTKIVYDWCYTGYQGRGTVSFELAELEMSTQLKLVNKTTEDWQEGIPEFNRESAESGWNYFITQSLKSYIDDLYS